MSHQKIRVCDECLQPDDVVLEEDPWFASFCSRCLAQRTGIKKVDENPRIRIVCHRCLHPHHTILNKKGPRDTDCCECGRFVHGDKTYLVRVPTGMEIMARAVEEEDEKIQSCEKSGL